MTREERNKIAEEIAWKNTKHYDPSLCKECWCQMAVIDALEWADEHPRKGLVDIDRVCEFLINYDKATFPYSLIEDLRKSME